MTSLDDTVLTKKNLALLDNATNYTRPALDYFHYAFNYDNLDVSTTWRLLIKMRKHRLLRLPSCSSENEIDYNIYMARLHHCMWRRWSIHQFKLDDLKIDPLSINWKKEIDVTLLYGPDLAEVNEREQASSPSVSVNDTSRQQKHYRNTERHRNGSSSSFQTKVFAVKGKPSPQRTISFDDTVNRRDIDKRGRFHESCSLINDRNPFQDYSVVWDERTHRYHRRAHTDANDYNHIRSTDNEIPRNASFDNTIIQQNLHSITEGSYIYIK
ncbi:hypothetical protein SEUBUCD646_0H01150 [Saccharomyces eubayanus]|uniref:YKR075C-like protein n=1 Tax=Saccharomyces eubayanus TaxID=1080349 RepID=A0ABN8VR14_SACEU|nr:hypothetical protein SEUBUCD650_0H01160 [Saccharomyces eubayanus]CAI2036577.1 hypothetical protein SEUBUCD646_0H01150 [Saccharomyces eubayanus]